MTMIALQAKFPAGLDIDAIWKTSKERMPAFRGVPGLLQKFYMQDADSGRAIGFYVFADADALDAFLGSELFRSLGAAYGLKAPPEFKRRRVLGTLVPLVDDAPAANA